MERGGACRVWGLGLRVQSGYDGHGQRGSRPGMMGMGMGSRGRAGFRGDGRCASGGGGPGVSVDEGLGFRAVMPVYPNQAGSG